MDRRTFLARAWNHKETPAANSALPAIRSGIKHYKGPWERGELTHLLRRTQFSVKKEVLTHFEHKSLKKTIKALIYSNEEMPSPPLNNYNDEKYTDPDIMPGQTWINVQKFDGMSNGRRRNSFKSWWTGLMINQSPTIREKMVLFWHNHFATQTNIVDQPLYCYGTNVLIREHATGNFRDLLKAITLDPGMLRYLNGYANTKKAPDENYGREMQELFTVGKGPDSHYTESDVKAAARVLTGYSINNKTYSSYFEPNRHDEDDKHFSSFYGNRVIKGIKGKEAVAELDELVDMILENEEVSKFICRKLYRFFVYHEIDAYTEQNMIRPMALIFRKKNYEIKPVLEALFRSEHFFDMQNRGCQIKSPLDFVVGLVREYDLNFNSDDYTAQYHFWEQVRNQAASMQQNIGDPPNVAGWQAYYQQPEFDKLWISSDTLPKRNQLTDRMINNGITHKQLKVQIDPIAFAAALKHPENADALIDESVSLLYAVPLDEQQKSFIKTNILLAGLVGMHSDQYWTNAWTGYRSNPGDKENKNIVQNKLKALYKYLMNQPEYQLC